MITYENRVGKLIEMRWVHPVIGPEVEKARNFMTEIEKKFQGLNVNIVDLRQGGVSSQDVVASSIDRLHHSLPARKGAILLADSAIQRMQLQRILREGGAPSDRVKFCFEVAEALGFLKDVLTPEEQERARVFLAG